MSTEQKPMPEGWGNMLSSDPYRQLLKKQRVWVAEYIRTGDRLAATALAYPKANPKSQRVMSYGLPLQPRVAAALEFWKWRDARAQVIAIAIKHLEACEPGSIAAQRLISQLSRLTQVAPLPSVAADPALEIATPKAAQDPRVPASALKVWLSKDGACVGYRDSDGTDIQF